MTTRNRAARTGGRAVVSALVVLVAAVLGSCSGTAPAGPGSSGTPDASGNAAGSTSAAGDDRAGSASGPVVLRVPIDAVLKEDYRTLAELAASASVDAVVAGDVIRATPFYQQQVPGTELAVRVITSNSKAVRSGSVINVLRDGGRIPLAQVLPDLKPQVKAQLPASPPDGAVVDFIFLGAAQSIVGDCVVAFLQRDPNPGRAGGYQLVSSVRGLLRLDGATGRYERLGVEAGSGVQTFVDRATAEAFARRRS